MDVGIGLGTGTLATEHRDAITIVPGAAHDYDWLARHHYRAHRPATLARVLCARVDGLAGPAGVLVVSMPTLRGSWRRSAWPECSLRTPRELNERVRCISRVIVDPRVRGLGVATALVRAYLAGPDTEKTEAITGPLADWAPIFRAAGMRELAPAEPGPADRRLLALLSAMQIAPEALARVDEPIGAEFERRLRIWARSSAATRALAAGSEPALRVRAAEIALGWTRAGAGRRVFVAG
jgi:GNAT superfamily N-acetyltransferase